MFTSSASPLHVSCALHNLPHDSLSLMSSSLTPSPHRPRHCFRDCFWPFVFSPHRPRWLVPVIDWVGRRLCLLSDLVMASSCSCAGFEFCVCLSCSSVELFCLGFSLIRFV
nr:hypothetical protein CFP56_58992 [Quercus suber]